SATRRGVLLSVAALGVIAAGVAAVAVGVGGVRTAFCVPGGELPGGVEVARSCSYVADGPGAVVAVLFCALTLGVLALSASVLRGGASVAAGGASADSAGASADGGERALPAGEYCFLLLCSLTGGVVLGYSRDLITLLVALETLTLPLYVLVGLRRVVTSSVTGAINFFVVSVISTTVTLMGAALLYALTGAVHLDRLAGALTERGELRDLPLAAAATVLVLVGLAFKVAAVPFHAWAPGTYDGAPLPVAAYLSTASKLGGVIALLYVVVGALRPWLDVVGPALAALAVLTMTVGNLVALRQSRLVRLLAWSSVAQAGYILAPLGAFALLAGRADEAVGIAVTATLAYTVFYVLIELGAFGAVVGMRGAADGGSIEELRGAAYRTPWLAAAFALALTGLAGLPPGLAGLFAKIAVVRALLEGSAGWLAVIVALNAVVGLAYYVRVGALLYRPGAHEAGPPPRVPLPVTLAVLGATAAALVVGFAPQLVIDAAEAAAGF
ncbi:MAG: NADH-quinone oxidoreductase subunit N, partial [Micromonosporaceae bacterium]|nr:NADH-quinone oxidoreductase subunit N [Micromonosporaceae bacterium]